MSRNQHDRDDGPGRGNGRGGSGRGGHGHGHGHGGNGHGGHGHGGGCGDDDDDVCRIDFRHIGRDIPLPAFIDDIEALIADPRPRQVAVGFNAPTIEDAKLFWSYDPHGGLHVETRAGYLDTETGDGGFSLDVNRDGSWRLHFHDSDEVIGHDADRRCAPDAPPPPPADNEFVLLDPSVRSYNAFRGNVTVDGGTGWSTVQGGVGDYMIGGSGTLGGGQDGQGNCAVYTQSPGSILVDMENGFGYGGSAEANVLVNMNQVRGSLYSNVLIGSHNGSDIKSGADNTVMISTGGTGFEMRPDGGGNVIVSTVGRDWILFDPTKGWQLGDQNIMLGFDAECGGLGGDGEVRGDFLDLRMLTDATRSDFHTSATPVDIDDYVRIVDQADGSHVFFEAHGNVKGAGVEILTMKFTHGLNVQTMFDRGNIVA